MLPTFIIGLREGLEAALIVGIIAAFLGQQGRTDALRQVWIGTVAAVVICIGIGITLELVSRELPQRQQEGLETVIGAIAVAMVTYMVLWMRKHARGMKGELEGHAASALATGSARALVAMAFLAVMREGFETAVFLLATFQHSTNPLAGGVGALAGIICAVAIGWAIFKGGVKLNLSRFFFATGIVLVLIAAGLVMSSLRTAAEAGWINFGQTQPVDLTWLVRPGTPIASLMTGVLGVPAKPATIELIGYFAYLIPMLALLMVTNFRPRRPATAHEGTHVPVNLTVPKTSHPLPVPESTRRSRRLSALGLAALLASGSAAGCAKVDSTASGSGSAGAVKVVLTDSGCEPSPSQVETGARVFEVTNDGANGVSEAELLAQNGQSILGERENITPGLSGKFSLTLAEGTYKIYCPGAKQDTWTFTVKGGTAVKDWKSNPALVSAIDGYATYVEAQAAELVTVTKALAAAVESGDIDAAKRAYVTARLPYEHIEPVAESFGDLDPRIDGRLGDNGDTPADFIGFHRIERALWADKSLEGMTPIAAGLVTDVTKLQTLIKAKAKRYDPNEVTNGALELMNEVLTSKITGEEERYSHLDLVDFQANLDGTMKIIDLLRPVLAKSAPDLLAKIDTTAKKLQTELDALKAKPGYEDSGFIEWSCAPESETGDLPEGCVATGTTNVTTAQRRALTDAGKPLATLLAEVPVKVVR